MDSRLTPNVFSFLDTGSQGRILCASAGASGLGKPRMLHWFAVSTMVRGIIVGKGWSDFSRDLFFLHSYLRGLHGHLVANGHDLQVMKSQCLFFIKLCTVLMQLGSYMNVSTDRLFNRVDFRQTSLFHPFPLHLSPLLALIPKHIRVSDPSRQLQKSLQVRVGVHPSHKAVSLLSFLAKVLPFESFQGKGERMQSQGSSNRIR